MPPFQKGNINTENMPTETVNNIGEIKILDFLSNLSIINSKSEARRLIEQGGIEIDNIRKNDINEILTLNETQELIVKKGKKTFVKVFIRK